MQKYISELTGTFIIAFALGVSANYIAVGSIIGCLTLISYPVSGAHFNPAITLALLIRKRIKSAEALGYIMAQFAGVIIAIVVFYLFFGRTYVLQPQQNINILKPFVIETVFTILIVLVYFKVYFSNEREFQKEKFWFAPGLSVMAAGLCGAALSGGAFNPALGLAPALVDLIIGSGYPLAHCWIYLLGPLLGAVIAVMIDKYIYHKKG